MKTKKRRLNFFRCLPLVLILILFSCNKDDDMNGEGNNPPIEFSNNGNQIFSFKCKDDNIEFFIDAVNDKSNGVFGTWPEKDIYRIFVDYNRNDEIDSGIDLMFSPKNDNAICVVSLIDQTSTSTCSFYDDVFGESLFTATNNLGTPHVNFKATIPKVLLSNSSSANIVIQLYDSETGWQYFPSDTTLFSTHFEINW